MGYCSNCGQKITDDAAFCCGCGAPLKAEISAPVAAPAFNQDLYREEREFLDTTHRLLRWEQKAWRIASKVLLILGIVFAAIFTLVFIAGIVIAIDGDSYGGGVVAGMGIGYAVAFGVTFIAIGIICKKACGKVTQYINTVYDDFSITYKRCGSVGMLIFTILFGEVAAVFFIINFVRMKSSRAVIERIMKNQNVHV